MSTTSYSEDDPIYRKSYYQRNKEIVKERRKHAYYEKKEKGIMINTCAKRVPDWLLYLPPGTYTLKQVAELTGQKYNNVYCRLTKLQVERTVSKEHSLYFYYNWKGAEYYAKKFLKEQFKRLD